MQVVQEHMDHSLALVDGRIVDGVDDVRGPVYVVNADASLKQFGGNLEFELSSIRRRFGHHSNVCVMPERLVVFIPVISVRFRYKISPFCGVRNVVAGHLPLFVVIIFIVLDILDDTAS